MGKRGKFVNIQTLGDLTALVNHNSQALERRVAKLCRRSRTASIFAVAALWCVVWSEMERRKQEEQIYQLSIKVKKLERSEGE